ncbi:MAG: DUF4227 family protein [Paenibacillaceae bacterium]
MVLSLRKFKRRMKFLVQLLVLTIVFYYTMHFITRWIDPIQKYRIPTGHSLKVFQQEVILEQQQSIKDRLALFYWMGE